jgi:hypothetical protein
VSAPLTDAFGIARRKPLLLILLVEVERIVVVGPDAHRFDLEPPPLLRNDTRQFSNLILAGTVALALPRRSASGVLA